MTPDQSDARPYFICIVQQLLMALGEEKDFLREALADLVTELVGGLNLLFYKDVPFLPVYIAAGSLVQFGFVLCLDRQDFEYHWQLL